MRAALRGWVIVAVTAAPRQMPEQAQAWARGVIWAVFASFLERSRRERICLIFLSRRFTVVHNAPIAADRSVDAVDLMLESHKSEASGPESPPGRPFGTMAAAPRYKPQQGSSRAEGQVFAASLTI